MPFVVPLLECPITEFMALLINGQIYLIDGAASYFIVKQN